MVLILLAASTSLAEKLNKPSWTGGGSELSENVGRRGSLNTTLACVKTVCCRQASIRQSVGAFAVRMLAGSGE